MDVYVLDTATREPLGVVDDAESVMWCPRYWDAGEFEVYAACSRRMVELFQPDRYVARSDSSMVGVIEHVKIETDPEEGDRLLVKGPCAKGLLGRRIVWGMQTFSGTVEQCARRAILDNAIAPGIPERAIPELVLGPAVGLGGKMEAQVTGKSLLDTVVSWLKAAGLGWEVVLNERRLFEVRLFAGADRSDSQSFWPRVKFSPDYDNLLSSNYLYDSSNLLNAVLVGGEGEGAERRTVSVGTAAGVSRREGFVDSRNTSSKGDGGLTDDEYDAMLAQQGEEAIAESSDVCSYAGDADTGGVFSLNEHFFLGDIVNVENQYGVKGASRIVEITECEDAEGYTATPVFEDWRLV